MLRECEAHGYFRGENCPDCGEEGKFLMNDRELNRVGKIMAGILRHFPDSFGLELDGNGWLNIFEMLEAVKEDKDDLHWLKDHHIFGIVYTDPKGRYEIDGSKIRATYGHSLNVDPDLPTDDIPETLFFPVAEEELEIRLERGLTPGDRSKVHLSQTYDDAMEAGRHQTDNPIVLEVDAAGVIEDGTEIGQAGKTVYTCDEVPAKFLKVAD